MGFKPGCRISRNAETRPTSRDQNRGNMEPHYILTGLLVGFLIGLTGMGGGSLMTPLLILCLGIKPTIAVGSDLAYSAITKCVGGFQHHRQGTVDYALACTLALGSIPGSLIGVGCVGYLHHLL